LCLRRSGLARSGREESELAGGRSLSAHFSVPTTCADRRQRLPLRHALRFVKPHPTSGGARSAAVGMTRSGREESELAGGRSLSAHFSVPTTCADRRQRLPLRHALRFVKPHPTSGGARSAAVGMTRSGREESELAGGKSLSAHCQSQPPAPIAANAYHSGMP
jgi:hypothetical protein